MPDEDDEDMEEWMALSDEQQEAMLDNALREHEAMINAMTQDEFYAYRRRRRVESCLRWRRLIRDHNMEFMKDNLRAAQRRLVALRVERHTGSPPVSSELN